MLAVTSTPPSRAGMGAGLQVPVAASLCSGVPVQVSTVNLRILRLVIGVTVPPVLSNTTLEVETSVPSTAASSLHDEAAVTSVTLMLL